MSSDPSNSKLTFHHWKIWFLSAMGVFMDGFDLFIIAVALPLIMHMPDWNVTAVTAGLIGAATPIGAIFGAVIFGRFTDKFGRKTILVLSVVFFVIFAGLSSIAWSPLSLIVFRFLLGVGIGADYPTGSTYVSETMPSHLRGRMLVGSFSFQAIGALTGAILGLIILYLNPNIEAWRWMLGLGVLPAVIVLVLRMSLPESPRWLLEQGKKKEAKRIALKIIGSKDILKKPKREPEGYRSLFKKKYRRRTALTSISWFLMDVSLYGVGFFTPVILAKMSLAGDGSFIVQDIMATRSAIYLDIFLVIGFVFAIFLVEKWGRNRLQKIGFIGMFIGLCMLATSTHVAHGGFEMVLLFGGFIIFNLMVNCGPNPTTYLLPAELFPTHIRATGHGFASCTGKIGAAVGIFLLPICMQHFGLGPTMYAIAGTALLGFLITQWLGVETKGKTLEEIENHQSNLNKFKGVA